MNKDWMEVSIVTTSVAIEAVSGILYNVGVNGISIEDPEDIEFKKKHHGDWDYLDNSLLKIKKYAVVRAYFEDNQDLPKKIDYIRKSVYSLPKFGIDKGIGKVTIKRINEKNWENNWKKYYKPTKVGNKIVIVPIWENYKAQGDDAIIKLDPGMAFGTGTHETTKMCIRYLEKYIKNESTVFDIGTGSGILSIVSSKLGAKHVVGVDLDMIAVESARKNVSYNNISNIDILHGNLMNVISGKADIIVANIIADIIIQLSGQVRNFLKKDGLFISSGIIQEREREVIDKLEKCNFNIEDINKDGEWFCIVARPFNV